MDMPSNLVHALPQHEQMVIWAAREWMLRTPEQPFTVLISTEEVCDHRALSRVKPGRKLVGSAEYHGYERVPCPYIVPMTDYHFQRRRVHLTSTSGAFVFSFGTPDGAFEVIFAANAARAGGCTNWAAIALVPSERMNTWADFQEKCYDATYRVERSDRVHIIGGVDRAFEPKVNWEDVILPERLKADLRADMESFFDKGVNLYKQLNLPAFRKLLLIGPPGTGKSSLCAALAKLALERKYVVVYVSASMKDQEGEGASFDKIQHAVRLATRSRYPVLLIVEEIDIYLKPKEKSQILNVLDGFESPHNTHGVLLVATTNYPEVIDERISQRPGRIDRIIHIPEIQDEDQATKMLRRYMSDHYRDEHQTVAGRLVGKTGAFVREASFCARMLALQREQEVVSTADLHESVGRLEAQLAAAKSANLTAPQGE
jgi:energy-coupling factor transporter ATP-binding protein EcfA2